jgi:signal transduction histidine kinase
MSTMNALFSEESSRDELARRHEEIVEKNKLLTIKQEELLKTSELLKELNEKKNNLMYILAHDLKSPLATVKALVLAATSGSKNIGLTEREVLQIIGEMTDKSQALIQKIMNAENFENLAYTLKLEKTDVSVILQEVIDSMKTLAADKSIGIQIQKEGAKDYNTLIDKIYLSQVYENLLNNAIKFSPIGKQVSVAMKVVRHTIRTEIKNEGTGIKQEEMSKLFGKWQKLSNQPTAGESSTGLGLSIVKEYVELLNGKVWCESKVGHGANFIVELPIH